MFQGIFKSALNDANKNYIFGTGSIPIQIKSAQLVTFADGTTKQQGYQVAEVNKLISTMLTGWDANGNKPKSMSDNYLELILSCDNGFVVKKRLQFPHIIAWKDDSTPYNIADVYKEFSIDNWLKADDFENPDITLVVEPTDEILTTSTATPPEVTTEQSGRFYLYYRNLPVGINRIHIDFNIKTKTEPIDFDLEIADGLSWKDAQAILASNNQAKINVLLSGVKDIYKYTGAEGNFENITMHEWSALYQQIISLAPSNKFTHDLYFYLYEESEINTKITDLSREIGNKVEENNSQVTVISDNTETLSIVDVDGNVIANIDDSGIHAPNISSLEAIENGENTQINPNLNLDEFVITDNRGYIGLRVSTRGVEGVGLNSAMGIGEMQNDLRTQKTITPILGTYGEDNAVYHFASLPKTFRLSFDFRMNDNVNVAGVDKPFVRIVGNTTRDVKPIHAIPSDLLVSRNGEIHEAISQVIGYNSGFNVCGKSYIRSASTNKPIVGDTAFALWLKGNFAESKDFPTAQEVSERASWLSSHKDAKIVFANDVFSVQGVVESEINVSIKDGSGYKQLGEFFDELTSVLGAYFDLKKCRLSASKTTADLLQFGTLNLVSNYWQQIDKSSTALSYNYDSFPVSIPLAIDESRHTTEIVCLNGEVWVSVDGQFSKYYDNVTDIYIGGTESESGLVTCTNLEYNYGNIGDSVLDDTYGVISTRTPRVIGVMQHLIEDKYEGENLSQSYHSSISRMLDIFKMLENRGYTILSLNDICLWLSGRKQIPARSIFFLATTNPTYEKFLTDMLSRELWTSASIPLIIGSIIKSDVNSVGGEDAMFKQVVSARAIGADYITHLYDHDVMPDYKNSLILQQELYKLIRLCISCGIDTRMYSYGWSCQSVNYFNMLSLNGFIGAMELGDPTTNAGCRYKIGRLNISDAMSIATLENHLI